MGVGSVNGDKPQVNTDKSTSKESAKESTKQFNDALGQSRSSSSSTQAAAGAAARTSGGKPTIVRIDANYHSKSATATLSDGSQVPLTLTKNQLPPGDTVHNLEYSAESGPEDSPVVELTGASGANTILWTQPADYALSPKVIVSIKQDPDEGARHRLEKLPQYIQNHVNLVAGDQSLEARAKMGEDLKKSGAKEKDFAPVAVQGKAPDDPDFKFVEAARKGRYSQFPSFDEFKKDLTRKVEAAKAEAKANGLNPPDPFAGAEWKDNPAAAREKWDKFVHAEYDKALKNEAAGLRHVGEVASMATNAIFQGIGIAAVLGTGGALGFALPAALESSTGIGFGTWAGTFGKFALGVTFGSNLINRTKEGIAAGKDPISIISTAGTDTVGGRAFEKITNESNLTHEKLNLSTGERVVGAIADVAEGVMNVMGLREFAKAPGVGEPPVPRRTSAEPTGNDAATTTTTQKPSSAESTSAADVAGTAGKGTTAVDGNTASTVKPPAGDVATSNTAKPSEAPSGGDAGDTMRLRKPGSGEASKPSDTTGASSSKTGETARDIPARGDTVKVQKAGAADAAKVESSASSAAGAKAGAATAKPTKSVDQIVDSYLQKRSPGEIRNSVSEGDIARMKDKFKAELKKNGHAPEIADNISKEQYRRMAMAEDVYRQYNQPAVGKPQPKITEAQLHEQLKKYDGPTESPDGWHVRMNKTAPANRPTTVG